ncbi:MAG TPA: hypothetical protein VGG72_06505 [Bryobacteraceae bacterium]|jgi:hypothetical protein
MLGRWLERVVIVAVAVLTIIVLVRWVKPVLDFGVETVHAHLVGCVVGGVVFLLLLAKAIHGTRDHSPRLYGLFALLVGSGLGAFCIAQIPERASTQAEMLVGFGTAVLIMVDGYGHFIPPDTGRNTAS